MREPAWSAMAASRSGVLVISLRRHPPETMTGSAADRMLAAATPADEARHARKGDLCERWVLVEPLLAAGNSNAGIPRLHFTGAEADRFTIIRIKDANPHSED